MLKILRHALLLILLILAALAPQWQSLEAMGERRLAWHTDPPHELIVGVSWPFAARQDGMADGLRLAQEQINAAGGLPVRLILRDDRDDAEDSRRIAMDFADTPGLSAVIGYHDDILATRASAIFESSRLLHLVVGTLTPSLTMHGHDYLVRMAPSSDRLARALATAASQPIRYAVIAEDEPYAREIADQFRIGTSTPRDRQVYEWSYPRERMDFARPIAEMTSIAPDVVFFAGHGHAAADFLRLARARGLNTLALIASADIEETRRLAGPAFRDVLAPQFYDPDAHTPQNQTFVRAFLAKYGHAPDLWAAQGYDALNLVAKAAAIAGSAHPRDLALTIRHMPAWDGAAGRCEFDGHGDLVSRPIVTQRF
ncbi:MAG TPA: ABC transporter substrate-binding protein [Patescibacteria group bacterium]|nr:ABC transporter substrate-binding protein [Patescibacteria group bacterium]